MKKGIIGKKIGMTQIFAEAGKVIPVTVIEAGPCVVAQKKTVENDGYDAVQLGYGYYLAGSNIINTNTFGAFETKCTGTDGKHSLEKIINAAFENAQKARSMIQEKDAQEGREGTPRFIAFDIGSCGKLLKPLGDLEFENAVLLFKKTFEYGIKNNPDLILIETVNDLYEAKAAVLAA